MSAGGKPRLGRITKMGDRYLRKLLVVGACSALAARKGHNDALRASGTFDFPRQQAEDMTAPEAFAKPQPNP